jgi:hypothetical protein
LGPDARRITPVVFLVTRFLGDGVRVFAGDVIAALAVTVSVNVVVLASVVTSVTSSIMVRGTPATREIVS